MCTPLSSSPAFRTFQADQNVNVGTSSDAQPKTPRAIKLNIGWREMNLPLQIRISSEGGQCMILAAQKAEEQFQTRIRGGSIWSRLRCSWMFSCFRWFLLHCCCCLETKTRRYEPQHHHLLCFFPETHVWSTFVKSLKCTGVDNELRITIKIKTGGKAWWDLVFNFEKRTI